MRAAVFQQFEGPLSIQDVPDPDPTPGGAVIRVEASGICRSDWHGWMGHDDGITLPHVPGHEIAGVVESVGNEVKGWSAGDRVTLPFVCGCGGCPECLSGNHQVCDNQFQPGFTAWGSFAEYVAIDYAETNLVRLPDEMEFVTAASLGCRFVTSFRALVDQAAVAPGQWVAVHGCGGVGLSAIMIAKSLGARPIAIDISEEKLVLGRRLGAEVTLNATTRSDVAGAIRDVTGGGAQVSVDALGNPETSFNSIACLAKRGKHIQIGLMLGEQSRPAVPMDQIIANELQVIGSHGIQAHRYPELLTMIASGMLHPEKLVGKTVSLDDAPKELVAMDSFEGIGVTVINQFR